MYLTTDLTELREYATFTKQSDMDATIYEYIDRLRADERPASVIEVLRFFGRSSLRVIGVSFAKYDTIAKDIGYSRRTVIRAVKTLESYGFIDKVPTLKKWSRYGKSRKKSVNVIRILAEALAPAAPHDDTAEATVEPNEDKVSTVNDSPEPSEFKHNLKSTVDTKEPIATTISLKHSLPQELYNVMAPFFNVKELYRVIGVLYRAKATVDRTIKAEDHNEYIEAFYAVIRRYKAGKVRDLYGYLYATWAKCSRAIKLREFVEIYG
ncbi:helix-turn-helix domain-containing protein [Thalassobacillus devorans]|uniref:helix-turn-helix domain-containing protein n=1 Tax=Thalassobacillus devorans TaxID=279813 RepID=UPI000A1C9339|nr:helix-turn-helix domain-containing protein [Thalassobacillus devorans]